MQDAAIKCYVVEPKDAAALDGETVTRPDHPIQGGGYSMETLDLMEAVPVDTYLVVSSEDAKQGAHLLAAKEGIFAGFSSRANLVAALQLLDGPLKGGNVAIVICASGLKYFSTELW